MKYEWRKIEKVLYQIKDKPTILQVPSKSYIIIDGKGDPNEEDFSQRVSALYALAYAIKIKYKKSPLDQDYMDFTVFPLEGLWKQENEGKLVKSELSYSIMIGQPNFVTSDLFDKALEEVKIKKPNQLYDAIRFEELEEGYSLAMLHVGPFDTEIRLLMKWSVFANSINLKEFRKFIVRFI